MSDDSKAGEVFGQLRDQIRGDMERLHVPGVAVGVWHKGREMVAGFGVTSVAHPLPVTGDTYYQIGSITKTFVATAVMRLVEMGTLSLDAPVRSYLPNLRLADASVAARVTMRHLLTHTAGWLGDYFDEIGLGDDAVARMVDRMAGLPQLTPLGELYSYNNAGFYLAGRVIEVVTGQTFEAAIEELVFAPLGLAAYFFANDVITHSFAVGHTTRDGQPAVARPWALGRAIHPAGGVMCTVRDLLRYARFHMGDGRAPDGQRVLTSQSMAQMQTPQFAATGLGSIGLAWMIPSPLRVGDGDGIIPSPLPVGDGDGMITPLGDVKTIGHGGATNGQLTELRIAPWHDFAVAVFTNSDDGRDVCANAIETALRGYLGIAAPPVERLALSPEKMGEYCGRYEAAMSVHEIVQEAGQLVLRTTSKGGFPRPDSPARPPLPPRRIAFYAEDRLIVVDEPLRGGRGEFVRQADGEIAWLRLGGRLHARTPRVVDQ